MATFSATANKILTNPLRGTRDGICETRVGVFVFISFSLSTKSNRPLIPFLDDSAKLSLPSAYPHLFLHLPTIGVFLGGVVVSVKDSACPWLSSRNPHVSRRLCHSVEDSACFSTTPPLCRGLRLSLDDSTALSKTPRLSRRLISRTPPLFFHLSSTMYYAVSLSVGGSRQR
ncbi:hypothetical protein N665_0071s0036 [Sinapis alba]|nr:hypothetical protein N665_0071s0036 [Sinapis alba]